MKLFIGIALIVVGAVLTYYGFQETESIAGEIEQAVTGSPSDRSIGMIIAGIIVMGAGAGAFFYKGA